MHYFDVAFVVFNIVLDYKQTTSSEKQISGMQQGLWCNQSGTGLVACVHRTFLLKSLVAAKSCIIHYRRERR